MLRTVQVVYLVTAVLVELQRCILKAGFHLPQASCGAHPVWTACVGLRNQMELKRLLLPLASSLQVLNRILQMLKRLLLPLASSAAGAQQNFTDVYGTEAGVLNVRVVMRKLMDISITVFAFGFICGKCVPYSKTPAGKQVATLVVVAFGFICRRRPTKFFIAVHVEIKAQIQRPVHVVNSVARALVQ